jgi:hypothetical protein
MTFTFRSITTARALILALAAAAIFAPSLQAAEPASEDPAALAATYTKQAADFRASAQQHIKMAQMHKAGAGGPKMVHESVVQHCERISENLLEAAKESDALAETYRKLAETK